MRPMESNRVHWILRVLDVADRALPAVWTVLMCVGVVVIYYRLRGC